MDRALAFGKKFAETYSIFEKADSDGELLQAAVDLLQEAAGIRTDVDRDKFAARADQLIKLFQSRNPAYKPAHEPMRPASDDEPPDQGEPAQPAKKAKKAAKPGDEDEGEEDDERTEPSNMTQKFLMGLAELPPRRKKRLDYSEAGLMMTIPKRE